MDMLNSEETAVEGGTVPVFKAKAGKEVEDLFRLARLGAWDDLVTSLRTFPSAVIRGALFGDEEASLLQVALTSSTVPVCVVEKLIQEAEGPSSIATVQNCMQQTSLHTAIRFIPERTDIVECLLREAPELINYRDYHNLRPIDILNQKVITSEEVIRHSQTPCDTILDDLWDTVHVLADANNSLQDRKIGRQPMVHACLENHDFPFALKERALKRYRVQLQQSDGSGNLPLHILARQPPLSIDDEEDDELLIRVLSLYPQGASTRNNENETPLSIAIRNGRRWNSGILRLLEAYPAAIYDLRLPEVLHAVLFAKILKAGKMNILYDAISSEPLLLHLASYHCQYKDVKFN
eukprot:scaffold52_cov183-Cylindrotheca_fusiformis.AAC.6